MDLNASPWPFVATFAALCVVMLGTMLVASVAVIARPERSAAATRWWTAYLTTWAAIVVLLFTTGVRASMPLQQVIAGLVLVAGGWLTLHLLWLWMWLSVERTSARRTSEVIPARADRLRSRAGQLTLAGLIAIALALIALGAVRSAAAFVFARGHRVVATTVAIAIGGFALLICGGVRLALGEGEPMTRQEIEELARAARYGPAGGSTPWAYRRSVYRVFGPAKGVKAEKETSIGAFKQAWRSGDWRRNHEWQTTFMMAAGALLMLAGGFSTVVAVATWPVKLLFGSALVYAAVRLAMAYRRA